MTAEILKVSLNVTVENLTYLVNDSLKSGTFSAGFKSCQRGTDIQIRREIIRPMSVLPVFGKIIERIVHEHLYNFLEENKLIYPSQFEFKLKVSPIHVFSDITEMIRDNSNLLISCILLDSRKVFDTMNKEYLLHKFGDYGACFYWFISYLSERNQCVSINGNVSKPLLIDCGVPQRPILGLLFFITHVNDFPISCKTIIAFYFR